MINWEFFSSRRRTTLSSFLEGVECYDDALELFKKTLPGASSFMQLQVTAAEQRRAALATIKAGMRKGRPELNFIALALEGKKVSFTKVLKMIDEMVSGCF